MHPKVPIHTISFNCSDREANQFLCDLAKESGGRFHYWSENGVGGSGPAPWEVSQSNGKFTSEVAVCDCNFDVANVARIVETKTEADRKWLVQNL